MSFQDEDLKIKITFPKKDGNILANADIIIKTEDFGPLKIKGFIIWKSEHLHPYLQEAINITPPARQHNFKYVSIIFFKEEKSWRVLEERIYYAYNNARLEAKNKDKNENVDPNGIPL